MRSLIWILLAILAFSLPLHSLYARPKPATKKINRAIRYQLPEPERQNPLITGFQRIQDIFQPKLNPNVRLGVQPAKQVQLGVNVAF